MTSHAPSMHFPSTLSFHFLSTRSDEDITSTFASNIIQYHKQCCQSWLPSKKVANLYCGAYNVSINYSWTKLHFWPDQLPCLTHAHTHPHTCTKHNICRHFVLWKQAQLGAKTVTLATLITKQFHLLNYRLSLEDYSTTVIRAWNNKLSRWALAPKAFVSEHEWTTESQSSYCCSFSNNPIMV